MYDLKGKSAIITGGANGIGRKIGLRLADEGCDIGIFDINEVEAQKTAADIRAKGCWASVEKGSVADKDDVKRGMMALTQQLGKVDILVNNAGIQFVAPIEEFPDDKWELVLAINLSASFYTIKAVIPQMKSRNWGRIINIASVHGLVASTNKAAYISAKHGLVGLTKVVALETAETGITVNAICPGWVLTPLAQKQIDAWAERDNISIEEAGRRLLTEKQPSKQFVTVEQLGELALFMCSDAASNLRGAAINIDGGWYAQ
jgi:3-hydroxybutyrate dehydrogenase